MSFTHADLKTDIITMARTVPLWLVALKLEEYKLNVLVYNTTA
jgi:hypothetical protein